MAMSAEHRSKIAALYRKWWRLHMSKKILEWDEKSKQTNKKVYMEHDIHVYGGKIQILQDIKRRTKAFIDSADVSKWMRYARTGRERIYNQPTHWLVVSGDYKGSGPSDDTE